MATYSPLTVRAWAPNASPLLRNAVARYLRRWRRCPSAATPHIQRYYSAQPYGAACTLAQRLAVMRYTL